MPIRWQAEAGENSSENWTTQAAQKLLASEAMRSPASFLVFARTCTSTRRPGIALVVFGAFLSYTCGGCLSNEYVIPHAELSRLTQLPPEQRGQRVRVVQELGDRRSEAIDTTTPEPAQEPGYPQGQASEPPPGGYAEEGVEPHVGVGIIIAPGLPLPLPPPGLPGPGFLAPPLPGPRTLPGGAFGRSPPRRPAASAPSGSGSLGKAKGGSGKDDLVALLIVVAVLATVGMVATEGARYDGGVAMYPWQPVHLKDGNGQAREVPLAEVTPADVAATKEALVMDDEGWGMLRLGRGPLDRQGFAFKMDVGLFHSSCACLEADGAGLNIQLGYFPHHRIGVLGTWSFSGGSDSASKSFSKNNLALEAQFFPLNVWRLHLGGFGHAGVQYADDVNGARNGAAFGGGLLLELGLTARLALSARVDYTTAKIGPDGQRWQAGQLYTLGVSIY
jgi:hypothetical protein